MLGFASLGRLLAFVTRWRAALYAVIVLATIPAWFLPLAVEPKANAGGFGSVVARVAYAFAPWTPLVPFAIARPRGPARVHLVLTVGAALALAAMTVFSFATSVTLACIAIAACIGVCLAELDAEPPAPLLAVGVLAIGALVANDLGLAPDRLLDAVLPGLPSGHGAAAAKRARVAIWLLVCAATFALLVDRRWLRLGSLRIGRGLVILVAGAAGGLLLRVDAYPRLLARASPARALAVWADHRRDGDALGVHALDDRAWPADAVILREPESAARWVLAATTPERRFLAIGPAALVPMNATYRAERKENLPVLSGEGAFLLGVNALAPGERSENPLDDVVRASEPPGLRKTTARLGEILELLGWMLVDGNGRATSTFTARGGGHVRIALRVRGALTGHCTFLHVDHVPTRYGAEHREHPYPMRYWRDGDVVVDDFAVELPHHFTTGSYALYWGVGVLPCQDDRRLPVTSGPSDGRDRVRLGRLEVQ